MYSVLTGLLVPPVDENTSHNGAGKYFRLALMTAILSVCFERLPNLLDEQVTNYPLSLLLFAGMVGGAALGLSEKYSRLGVLVFSVMLVPYVVERWFVMANHGWLGVWTIVPAALFAKWWTEPAYSDYLRLTLGIVMLAAAAQKLLAGTYLDGSYIAYLSHYGSTTENMFQFLCSQDTLENPCGWHKFLGTFIVLWQTGVGLLLLAGLRSVWFLMVEVGFLLGAGLYADEMNFQVLNIALLCIAFRVGMSYALFAVCAVLLVIDQLQIGWLVRHVF